MDNQQQDVNQNPDLDRKAVALKYDQLKDRAPKVIAKGRGHVAEHILAAAQKHTIPVYQNKALVNMLMALEIDREIPPELYKAIAEVMAYVYRMDSSKGREERFKQLAAMRRNR